MILLIATAFVALISEFLVGAVEAARGALGFTEVFVGVIVGFVALALVSAMYGVLGGMKEDVAPVESPAPVVQIVDLEGPGVV